MLRTKLERVRMIHGDTLKVCNGQLPGREQYILLMFSLICLFNISPLVFIPLKIVNVLERSLFLSLGIIDEVGGDFRRSLYNSDLMCYFC